MLRLTEAALFALPFLAFLAWRLAAPRRGIPGRVVVAAALSLAMLAFALAWFGMGRALPPASPYVPARMGANGQVVGPEQAR